MHGSMKSPLTSGIMKGPRWDNTQFGIQLALD